MKLIPLPTTASKIQGWVEQSVDATKAWSRVTQLVRKMLGYPSGLLSLTQTTIDTNFRFENSPYT